MNGGVYRLAESATPDLLYIPPEVDFNRYDGPFYLFKNTNFRYMPTEGSPYLELSHAREFRRLESIRQLGTITTTRSNTFQDQTRALHSMVTGMMADLVLTANGFDEHQRRVGIAAGMLHDIAMMPYSDQGKLLEPGKYEEEDFVRYVLERSHYLQETLQGFGVAIDEVVAAVQGHGLIGTLINSRRGIDVDNLSYLAIDQSKLVEGRMDEIQQLVDTQGIFDQYNNLRFVDGELAFDDPQLLLKLVKFRALMYANVYQFHENRAKEAFLQRRLNGHHIELDDLLSWGDIQFGVWFHQTFGERDYLDFFSIGGSPFKEVDREYDLSKLEEIKQGLETQDGNVVVARLKPARPAVRNRVIHEGEVVWLDEIPEFREEVEDIRRIIHSLDYIGVYRRTA